MATLVFASLAAVVVLPLDAHAQARTAARPSASQAQPSITVRGFGDVGMTTFSADKSFKAVLGSASGPVFGGGVEVVLPMRITFGARVSRFNKSGSRAFVLDGEAFDLGIPTTVTVTPIELAVGYRFGSRRSRLVPYVSGGLGWYKYREVSDFATEDENTDTTSRGYLVLGGVEYRVARWIGVAGEAQWTRVPYGLGQDPNGVSAAFNETNLGGRTFRVKVIVGR